MTEDIKTPKLSLVENDEAVEDHEDVTPEKQIIFEIKQFQDGDGRHVIAHLPIDQPDNPSFVGNFIIPVQIGNGVRPIQMEITFPEGFTLEDCFEQFDSFAQKTVEEAQKEVEDKNRIITPNQMGNDPNIFVKNAR
jgi:hypothetical protein